MASFDRPTNENIPPSPWIMRFMHLMRPGGGVLDVAAGHGRHTHALLEHGYTVTAADVDMSAFTDQPNLNRVEVDLEAEAWPFSASSFDGIVMTNYLHRPHFPHLIEALAPGGVLLIETFGEGNEKLGRPRNPEFLLKPGDLLDAFGRHLHVVAYEHCAEHEPRPAVRQRICVVKADGPMPCNQKPG
jgi:SAM-dependent methyltransferase